MDLVREPRLRPGHRLARRAVHQPTALVAGCGLATNAHNETHPSLPNYIAATSGLPPGALGRWKQRLQRHGRLPHARAEPLRAGALVGRLRRVDAEAVRALLHGPLRRQPQPRRLLPRRWPTARSTTCPYGRLQADLDADTLPAFVFITPNMCHSMHNCSVRDRRRVAREGRCAPWSPARRTSGARWRSSSPSTRARRAAAIAAPATPRDAGCHVPILVVSPSTPPGTRSGDVVQPLLAAADHRGDARHPDPPRAGAPRAQHASRLQPVARDEAAPGRGRRRAGRRRGAGAARRRLRRGHGGQRGASASRCCDSATTTCWCSTSACPDVDGLTLLRRLRERQLATPVLVLTARGEIADRVAGLDAGADDYLQKPFAFPELLARLRALLRRGVPVAPTILRVGDLELDPARFEVRRQGQVLVAHREGVRDPRVLHAPRGRAHHAHDAARELLGLELRRALEPGRRPRQSAAPEARSPRCATAAAHRAGSGLPARRAGAMSVLPRSLRGRLTLVFSAVAALAVGAFAWALMRARRARRLGAARRRPRRGGDDARRARRSARRSARRGRRGPSARRQDLGPGKFVRVVGAEPSGARAASGPCRPSWPARRPKRLSGLHAAHGGRRSPACTASPGRPGRREDGSFWASVRATRRCSVAGRRRPSAPRRSVWWCCSPPWHGPSARVPRSISTVSPPSSRPSRPARSTAGWPRGRPPRSTGSSACSIACSRGSSPRSRISSASPPTRRTSCARRWRRCARTWRRPSRGRRRSRSTAPAWSTRSSRRSGSSASARTCSRSARSRAMRRASRARRRWSASTCWCARSRSPSRRSPRSSTGPSRAPRRRRSRCVASPRCSSGSC